jgi:hypothetical protein
MFRKSALRTVKVALDQRTLDERYQKDFPALGAFLCNSRLADGSPPRPERELTERMSGQNAIPTPSWSMKYVIQYEWLELRARRGAAFVSARLMPR